MSKRSKSVSASVDAVITQSQKGDEYMVATTEFDLNELEAVEREAAGNGAFSKEEIAAAAGSATITRKMPVMPHDLIAAGTNLTIDEEVLHIKNLRFYSNEMCLNLKEGTKGTVITEPGKVKAALVLVSQLRFGEVRPFTDELGLLQLKISPKDLIASEGDKEDVGYVSTLYTGKYAHNIAGLTAVQTRTPRKDATEFDDTPAWCRLNWTAGQLKVAKVLRITDGMSNDETHDRKSLLRALVYAELLKAEAEGSPLIYRWSDFNTAAYAAYFIGLWKMSPKSAYEFSREHYFASITYKQEARVAVAAHKTQTDIVFKAGKETSKTVLDVPEKNEVIDLVVTGTDGQSVDLAQSIGKTVAFFQNDIPLPMREIPIAKSNVASIAKTVAKNDWQVVVF